MMFSQTNSAIQAPNAAALVAVSQVIICLKKAAFAYITYVCVCVLWLWLLNSSPQSFLRFLIFDCDLFLIFTLLIFLRLTIVIAQLCRWFFRAILFGCNRLWSLSILHLSNHVLSPQSNLFLSALTAWPRFSSPFICTCLFCFDIATWWVFLFVYSFLRLFTSTCSHAWSTLS